MAMQPVHKPSLIGAAIVALLIVAAYHLTIGRKR